MKALLLYVALVVISDVIAGFFGVYVERQTSSAISLIVFLALFFGNFVGSWLLTIFIMDGSFKNAQGRDEQVAAELAGKAKIVPGV